MGRAIIVYAAFLSLIASCTPSPVGSTGPQSIRNVQQANIEGPVIPAGTRFRIRMEQTLDTLTTVRNQRFTAVVLQPLVDRNGNVIVPREARVRGHVESVVGTSGVPRLRLHFDGVESVAGTVPLPVRVVASDGVAYRGPVGGGSRFLYDSWDGSYAGPYGGGPSAPWVAYGGYSAFDHSVYTPREVHLSAGATLDLVLTRPLVVPPARTPGN